MKAQQHFEFPGCASLAEGAAALQSLKQFEIDPEERVSRTFLDTFDWRLWNAGLVLERLSVRGRTTLALAENKTGATLFAVNHRPVPRFADDLPRGFLSDRVGELLSMRALMPIATMVGRRCPVTVRDREGKAVVRGSLEDIRASLPGKRGRGEAFGPRLFLEPVRGYEKVFDDLGCRLGKAFVGHKGGLFDLAAARLGLVPGDYSSKLRLALTPEMRADEAMRIILRDLFDTMRRNEAGLLDDVDTEFLHDFRVAIRRTRSVLAQAKGVLPPRTVDKYKNAFRWLGQVTGPLRDLDVYLLTFNDYRGYLPGDYRGSLDPLKAELERRRVREFKAVARTLRGARYKRLRENWATTLDGFAEAPSTAPDAALPVTGLADARIWKLYKRVLREGAAIEDNSPPEALHELRKTCKKLRYMMEFFQSLHDKDKVKERIKALKVLLDDLGAFQDYAVQAETLEELGHDMEKTGTAPRDTLLAMAILTDALHQRQLAARAAFAEIFEAFAAKPSKAAFKDLYKS